jgi:ssDNA-binding replication factor A large subunit
MSDLYCDVSNKNTFQNVRFVCMSNLNISLENGKIAYNNNERRSVMNLDEFKAHVTATRQASKAEAISALSATMLSECDQ